MSAHKPDPCPFCGGRAEFKAGHYTGYVMCLKCEVMGPNLPEAEAVAAWNQRATQPTASNAGERALLNQAAEALDWLLKNIRRDAPQLSGKAMGNADAALADIRAALASKPPAGEQKPDMRAVCEALGFDPTNHHNAAKCPYCRPQPEQVAQDREHAENYRLIRRGQHWSVVDGIGNTLRGEDLDAAVDAIRAARARGEKGGA